MQSYQNVWEAITDDPHEAKILSIKSKLTMLAVQFIRNKQLTQAEVSLLTGVSQPRISNMMRGQLDKFSIDMLLTLVSKLGIAIEIGFDPEYGLTIQLGVVQ
jgi:predicted XRE-type DNA-binding protein